MMFHLRLNVKALLDTYIGIFSPRLQARRPARQIHASKGKRPGIGRNDGEGKRNGDRGEGD